MQLLRNYTMIQGERESKFIESRSVQILANPVSSSVQYNPGTTIQR